MASPHPHSVPLLLLLTLLASTGCPGATPWADGGPGDGAGEWQGWIGQEGGGPRPDGGIYSGCFEPFDQGGEAFTPSSTDLFAGPTSVARGWNFLWDGVPRGRHQKNEFVYLAPEKAQRIVADGSSLVLYKAFPPNRLPKSGVLQLKYTADFDTSASGTPASQGCTDAEAGWIEILMTNDIKGVIRAIVWKNDGSKDGSFDLKQVCPATDPDNPGSAQCFIGIKVGAHQDGRNTDPSFPCLMGNFIFRAVVDDLCLK